MEQSIPTLSYYRMLLLIKRKYSERVICPSCNGAGYVVRRGDFDFGGPV